MPPLASGEPSRLRRTEPKEAHEQSSYEVAHMYMHAGIMYVWHKNPFLIPSEMAGPIEHPHDLF